MSHIHPKKYARIMREQSKEAQIVYEATPIKTPWSVQKICSEVVRMGNSPIRHDRVNGSLRHLQRAGVIREVGNNCYQRIPIAMKTPKPRINPEPKHKIPEVAVPQDSLLDRFSRISDLMRNAAEEIDNLALDIQSEIESAEAKSKKLKNLQQLLKAIQDES